MVRIIRSLLLLGLFFIFSVNAQENQKNILVLYSYHTGLPFIDSLLHGLEEGRAESDNEVVFFHENMDTVRLKDALSSEEWIHFLSKKYQDIEIHGVIAESQRASSFVHEYGRDLWGDVPKVLYTDVALPAADNTLYLSDQSERGYQGTLKMALEQNPNAEEVVILDSHLGINQELIEVVKEELSQIPDVSLRVIPLVTVDQMLQDVSLLSPKDIVFYTLIFSDSTGTQYVPKEILKDIAAHSPAPVYSFWSSLMDTGIVGGIMIDPETTGRVMVQALMDFFKRGSFSGEYSNLQGFIDWNVLNAHGISSIPDQKEFTLINRPVTPFSLYFKEFLLSLIALFAVLVLFSAFWIRKLSLAQRKLQESNKALEAARLEAENLSKRDALTNLLNRRAVSPIIEYEIKRKKRLGNALSMMVLDIDHFKRVNDTYGHDAGDAVLKTLSEELQKLCRNTDTVSRWGGEEFLILVPDTDGEKTQMLAEKIRKALAKLTFPKSDPITVSLGVAECQTDENFQHWFERTDEALYQAKKEGRNRSVLAENP